MSRLVFARLRNVESDDLDLATWRPDQPEDFGVYVRLLVGDASSPGADAFGVTVCTPAWLSRRLDSDPVILGMHHVVVAHWHYPSLRQFLEKIVNSVSGETWAEVAGKLSRVGSWEFDGYMP